MTPCIVLTCSNPSTRRRGQAAMMDAGGRWGFHWYKEDLPGGGAVYVVVTAPESCRQLAMSRIEGLMAMHPTPRGDWVMGEWQQGLTTEQMARIDGWYVEPKPKHQNHA